MKETVTFYIAKDEVDKILIEATANENWNISNTKLQILADATFQSDNLRKILEHFKQKLESPQFEWRRILKVRRRGLMCVVAAWTGVYSEEWKPESAVGTEERYVQDHSAPEFYVLRAGSGQGSFSQR